MNVVLEPNVHEISVMKSTQLGYSDAVLNNIVGYFVDVNPRPMMMIQPTIENARDFGKKRITPMIQACPALRDKIKDPTSRRSGNTMQLKEFPGGFLKLTGANSGAGLRSDPVPIVLEDEVDGFPLDVEGEGDPDAIATRRTDAFADFKIYRGSTPAKPKGVSPIERHYLRSDMRRFYVPCPFCGLSQVLWWRDPQTKEYRLYYEVNEDNQVKADSVAYICSGCKGKIAERYKQQMTAAGKWIAEFPERPKVGFHINALYSPWKENWPAIAQEWHEANKEQNPEKLKAFVTLRLAETWEEQGDAIEVSALRARVEPYQADIPDGVGLLTAAVDVQNDRLEIVVKGWGDKEESWLVAYEQMFGDPGDQKVWDKLDTFLRKPFSHRTGAQLGIGATMIDSGGSNTEDVYRFVKPRQGRNIWACKGTSEAGREILGRYSMNNSYGVKLWSLGVDTAKDRIFARMKIPLPGPGFMHLPDWTDDEYLEQLTSERATRKYKRGRGMVRMYIKTRARNEALDLEVYALAALYTRGKKMLLELKARARSISEGKGDTTVVRTPPVRRRLHPGVT